MKPYFAFEHFMGVDDNGCELRDDPLDFGKDREHTIENFVWYSGLTVVTNEGWGGTFEGGRLNVSVHPNIDGTVSVFVCGNDDFSMVRRGLTEQAAERVLKRIPIVITRECLASMGFSYD